MDEFFGPVKIALGIKKGILIFGLAVGCVLLIAAGYMFYLQSKDKTIK